MWDRKGVLVYESSAKSVLTSPDFTTVETHLEVGERIVGIKSHTPKDFED
jgi:hypothetical protein